jgi:hypothetical protein
MDPASTTSTAPADDSFALSLVRNDFLFRLQRRIGLIPAHGLGLGRRLVFWPLLAWLPIAVWAEATGRALPAQVPEPLLTHFGIHVRFLVAVPLFILAEGVAHGLTMRLLPHFVRSGIVPPSEVPRLRAALTRVAALRDAVYPWVVILALVVSVASISAVLQQSHEIEWAVDVTRPPGAEAALRQLGFGAWWFLFVGRPIYLTLLLGWLWRTALLAILFRSIAKLDLAIVPTHPDGTGGLGFLERLPATFAPVALAISAVTASGWAHGVVYHGVAVQSLRLEMGATVLLVLLIFLSPMLVFAGVLRKAKRQALLDYGVLVGRHGRLVHERWIEGRPLADDAILSAPELGPVADTIALYGAVREMRTVPMGKASVAPLILAAIIPLVVVLAIEIPVKDILKTLVTALL